MDDIEKKRVFALRCVVKAIMLDKVNPNEINVEAIHASSIRLITNFMLHPSPDFANAIVRMLDALAKHQGTFQTDSSYNVYHQASLVWRGIADNMMERQTQECNEHVVH